MIRALLGPTASGKTALALDLAPTFDAEVVSVDSMQVYRGMDVGTAKPTPDQQRRTPHHAIDTIDPGEPFSVAAFQEAARAALVDITSRGRTAILVGGSGLYFRAIADNLEFPPTDTNVRDRLAEQDPAALWTRLVEADPVAASRIEPNNVRRIVRALEVMEITGKPFSSFRTAWDTYNPAVRAAGLRVSTPTLRARIEARTAQMFAGAIQAEAERLRAAGYAEALSTTAAIGYHEALDVLDGSITVAEAIETTVRATMELARRQMRWFRRDPRITWFDAEDLERTGDAVASYWSEPATAAAGGA